MIIRELAVHRAHLNRLLNAIVCHRMLPRHIAFKGGTCAAMLGYLDRFSVDLDFDFFGTAEKPALRKSLYEIFNVLDLTVRDESDDALQFFLKYDAPVNTRNSLKLEILDKRFVNNKYEIRRINEINRDVQCQTLDTLVANKLVAITERFETTGHIAGRDLYDIAHFLKKGYPWNKELISERKKMEPMAYFELLQDFISTEITQTIIDRDLNVLLEAEKFRKIRKTLKTDTLLMLSALTGRSFQV